MQSHERQARETGDEAQAIPFIVDCVEIQPGLAADLKAEDIYNRVFTQDFLTLTPATTRLYDRVIMNPPLIASVISTTSCMR